MEPLTTDALIQWLNTLPYPRPFVWQRYVYWRRAIYALVTLLMLLGFVGVPFFNGLTQSRGLEPKDRLFATWTTIILGAFIVYAFARVSFNATKMFDDCKWLARFGAVGEATLLWVLGNDKAVSITYSFWDIHGRERQREVYIAAEGDYQLPRLAAGDTIPVLFDPHKSDQRNQLWLEVTRYVRLSPRVQAQHPAAERPAMR
ncbi:MAG: hypothetical protein P4L33_16110 [Capsulimonadaceae bacterium]|nr:hypothetical protein [Capsulimonadaceae bacterium]